jgi:CRISPR-associated protein Csd1
MLRSLVESAARFEGLPPIGYERIEIRWVIDLCQGAEQAALTGPFEIEKFAPVRGERSGKVSESNLKPALLVDNAKYALGLSAPNNIDSQSFEHRGFKSILRKAVDATADAEASQVYEFLHLHWPVSASGIEKRILDTVKPKDKVAFRVGSSEYPFERAPLRSFWCDHLREEYSGKPGYCAICGRHQPILRVLPWQVTLFGLYSCPISSFNASAFDSFGKKQTANSPLCFDCAATASSVLQFLVDPKGRHTRVLACDDSKGGGKSPLKNQLAIFWLKDLPEAPGGELNFDLEAALAEPMTTSADRDGPPPDPSHADALYGLPWRASASGLQIARTRFYVAVLSPNKSRLVLRDWIDTSLDAVCHKLKRYDDARTIVSSDGRSLGRVPVQDMLWAIRPWKSRSAGDSANLVRGLVRTAYLGAPPPPELLEIAVQRFRVPVRPGRQDEAKFETWRQAQAAAIKLVLTYETEEAITLQSVNIEGRSAQHLCGQLLAILEEAQLRASRWRINATLVDRFYGGASTSPSITLGGLLKQATQAHMPKIRKAGFGYEELEKTLESITEGIDQLGGFPATLTLRQQGEFALGFYLRRAAFRAARPKREPAPGGKTNSDTGRSQ